MKCKVCVFPQGLHNNRNAHDLENLTLFYGDISVQLLVLTLC